MVPAFAILLSTSKLSEFVSRPGGLLAAVYAYSHPRNTRRGVLGRCGGKTWVFNLLDYTLS